MYGGTTGIRDINMLNSALESPFQTWGGKDLCKTLEEKAIHLCYSDYILIFDDDDLIKLIYGIADGSLTIDDSIAWIKLHVKKR